MDNIKNDHYYIQKHPTGSDIIVMHMRNVDIEELLLSLRTMGSDYIAELTSELESVINKEVMETRERILHRIPRKNYTRIDEDATDKQLDLELLDLIKRCIKQYERKCGCLVF